MLVFPVWRNGLRKIRLSGVNFAPFEEALDAINTVQTKWNERKGK